MSPRRRYARRSSTREYRRIFVIATEGSETEPQYFRNFRESVMPVIRCISHSGDSAPTRLIESMEKYLDTFSLRATDEAWIVVDVDIWSPKQLAALVAWAAQDDRFHLAVSNPQFEYWLLLHFEDGHNVMNARECMARLRRAMPGYKKSRIEWTKLEPGLRDAISRARNKDQPPCSDWPHSNGSTVYRLVSSILE